jgi:universal stress protein A
MPDYKKILLVVDLSEDSQIVGERAKAIAACYKSEITLLHVVEYVPVEPMGEALPAKLALNDAHQLVETGGIKTEIIRTAQRLSADLIVLGSRERHGLAILLNFTEDTILHAAPCDVLAVRLH